MHRPMNTVRFDSIPPVEVRDVLKRYGFRWNRGAGCWQAPASIATATVADHFRGGNLDVTHLDEHVAERGMEEACGII